MRDETKELPVPLINYRQAGNCTIMQSLLSSKLCKKHIASMVIPCRWIKAMHKQIWNLSSNFFMYKISISYGNMTFIIFMLLLRDIGCLFIIQKRKDIGCLFTMKKDILDVYLQYERRDIGCLFTITKIYLQIFLFSNDIHHNSSRTSSSPWSYLKAGQPKPKYIGMVEFRGQ